MLNYYIAYKNERIGAPLSKEEALCRFFELKGEFKDICILVYDQNDKLVNRIPKK
jgi:hypothetical protein